KIRDAITPVGRAEKLEERIVSSLRQQLSIREGPAKRGEVSGPWNDFPQKAVSAGGVAGNGAADVDDVTERQRGLVIVERLTCPAESRRQLRRGQRDLGCTGLSTENLWIKSLTCPAPDEGITAQVRNREVRCAVAAIGRTNERKQIQVLRNDEELSRRERRTEWTERTGKHPKLAQKGAWGWSDVSWNYAVRLHEYGQRER